MQFQNKLFLFLAFTFLQIMESNAQDFTKYLPYAGGELGAVYTKSATRFRVWSPNAEEIKLRFYAEGAGGKATKEFDLKKAAQGTWAAAPAGDFAGQYYTFQVKIAGKWLSETTDPYVKAVGVNGKRGMVLDLSTTNPDGWATDKSPELTGGAVLYELHVRDASIAKNSGIKDKGKFLGLTEIGTLNTKGLKTGIDHIKELGVTHVHLLPSFDYLSVDESSDKPQYNWGYDPQNYNVPEGSYATNAANGSVRIKEFKTLIKTFHDNNLNVVMDVVYNHTRLSDESSFSQLVPGYYYRQKKEGGYSNGSGCGNETASERPMMRKFMIESCKYWLQEYHVDGFRFDLMGLHDIETMNLIANELRKIKPNVLLYGEGWTAGDSPLPEARRSIKKNAMKLNDIAVFSDDIRDGLKGGWADKNEKGFVSGKPNMEESIKFGLVGAVKHDGVNYEKVNYSKEPYATKPYNTISYNECHDNHTLWDRLKNSNPNDSEEERIKMALLAQTIVFTSQGIPFLHAGAEFCRTKGGIDNSFESSDEVNQLDWDRKTQFENVFKFHKKLIAFRKAHPAFRLGSDVEVQQYVTFPKAPKENFIAYQIKDAPNGEEFQDILLLFNANKSKVAYKLPSGTWSVALNGNTWVEKDMAVKKTIDVPAIGAVILYRKK
jgi:pullulanase